MRACETKPYLLFVFVGGEWHSKTNASIGVDAPVIPHPNPLRMGEEATISNSRSATR